MGKRSSFARIERDKYVTPVAAVLPLLPHLPRRLRFIEPCAGNGALIQHLERFGHTCAFAGDIEPEARGIRRMDALDLTAKMIGRHAAAAFVTNPPWSRPILHTLIERLPVMLPTWLLFDADWPHTKQAATLLERCVKIVAIGRIKWMPGSEFAGKDNAAWYLFTRRHRGGPHFYGRATEGPKP